MVIIIIIIIAQSLLLVVELRLRSRRLYSQVSIHSLRKQLFLMRIYGVETYFTHVDSIKKSVKSN